MRQEAEGSAVIDIMQHSVSLSFRTDMCAMLLLLPSPMQPAYSATRWRRPETATCRLHKCGGGAQGKARQGHCSDRGRGWVPSDHTGCKDITLLNLSGSMQQSWFPPSISRTLVVELL